MSAPDVWWSPTEGVLVSAGSVRYVPDESLLPADAVRLAPDVDGLLDELEAVREQRDGYKRVADKSAIAAANRVLTSMVRREDR